MSSDRATTRADFTPGGRDQLVEGDHGAGADLVDLAAHAELGQHASSRRAFWRRAASSKLDGAGLGLGQHGQFGQAEAAGLDEIEGLLVLALSRGRSCAAGCCGGLTLSATAPARVRPRAWAIDGSRSAASSASRAARCGRAAGGGTAGASFGRGRAVSGRARRRWATGPARRMRRTRGQQAASPAAPSSTAAISSAPGRRARASTRVGRPAAGVAPEAAQALRQRPVGRRRRRGEQADQARTPTSRRQDRAIAAAPARRRRVASAARADAGEDHHRGDQPGPQAQRLQAEVGGGRRPVRPSVARRLGRGGVEAGIGRMIGGEGRDQAQAETGDQRRRAPARPADGSSRRRPYGPPTRRLTGAPPSPFRRS